MSAAVIYLEHALTPHKRRLCQVETQPIAALDPRWRRPYIALLDGHPLLRAEWHRPLPDGATLAFIDVNAIPMGGGDGGSNPVRIIAMLAVMYFAGPIAGSINNAAGFGFATDSLGFAALKAGVGFIGSALVNALIPPPRLPTPQIAAGLAAPSPTYSLQAQGNSARLDAAIPESFGRLQLYPDFGAQPYAEYVGNEMYLYQLLVIGRGEYDIEAIRIDDTPISSWEDIDYEVVAPGGDVTLFPATVSTSIEVSGQDLPTSSAIGPYTANSAGTTAIAIAVDLIYPRGLYHALGDGSLGEVSVVVEIEAREIDDSGSPIGSWGTLGTETVTAATTTPQRRSYRYTVAAGRYEVRATRTDTEETTTDYGHDVIWGGLRAYLPDVRDYGDVTLLVMRMRASSQLSAQASRKINVIATRKLPVWDGSAWSGLTPTRSIAWALAYVAKQIGLDDADIDLATLLTYDHVWETREDYFDGRFDNFLTFWEAVTKIAVSGRAKPFLQAGILRVFRDEAQTVPVQLYSMRNIVRGSFSIDYLMPSPETADCVDVSYFDAAVWASRKVRASLPGSAEDSPAKVDLFGVTSRDQAYREGMYQAASNRYRRRLIHFRTEMEGFIPSLGDLIAVQHDMPAWGQRGEVVAYGLAENRIKYSEALDNAGWWGKVHASITANAGTAPNGTVTADKLVESTTANAPHYVYPPYFSSPGEVLRFSICGKALERSMLGLYDSQSTTYTKFDLANGVIFSDPLGTAEMEDLGDGWYRCSCASSFPNTSLNSVVAGIGLPDGTVSYTGDGASGLLLWGAHLYLDSGIGVYLPTTSAVIPPTNAIESSEPLTWTDGATHYIGLRKPDGSIDGPIVVTGSGRTMALSSSISFTPYTGGAMERTHFSFGPSATEWRQFARLLSARPVSATEVEILAVAEDDNVHTAEDGITTPTAPTSGLANYTAAPRVSGLISRSKPGDATVMLLSWQPSPWADHYLVELSADGQNWTRVDAPGAANCTAPALYGSATIARVAAVNLARGPWVQIAYGADADYMWSATDTDLMWGTSTDPMWGV